MQKQPAGFRSKRYYRIGALERALTRLRDTVIRPQDMRQNYFSSTEAMMLLEAARIGYARMIENPELIDAIPPYPFP